MLWIANLIPGQETRKGHSRDSFAILSSTTILSMKAVEVKMT